MNNISESMTSLEIAELTGKDHRQVTRDIKKMLKELEIEPHFFLRSYLSSQNKHLPMFELDKRFTWILLTGYDLKTRVSLIDFALAH